MRYFQRLFLITSSLIGFSNLTLAQENNAAANKPLVNVSSDCAARATEKKLAGAALNSFTKKCERDAATVSCATAASEKRLRGAAKNSFTKKCIKDSTDKN